MHIKELEVGLKLFEGFESIEPDVVAIAAKFEADNGRKPTIREIWPNVKHAGDQVVAGPLGTITV